MMLRRRRNPIARMADTVGIPFGRTPPAKRVMKTVRDVARRTPILRRLPILAGAGVAAFAASRALRTPS
jgi:hypothetical protein